MSFEKTTVQEWMTSPVISITPGVPISEAHQVMKENNIRRLPVVENNMLVGMLTLGDVREASPSDATTLSIWEINYLWSQLTAKKVMSRKVMTVTPETPILDAAATMLESKVSGLPVIDKAGKVLGIITESDIFRMLVSNRQPAEA